MDNQRQHQIIGGIVALVSFIVYFLTMAPTASFWDCGEFIAISQGLQVSHPPGAPFYMLIGRLFSMFTSPEMAAWSVNLMSVIFAAATTWLTYLIIVRLIEEWKGSINTWDKATKITGFSGGVIGALAFAWSDSNWFNSVEAEVYSMSMLFTAIVIWMTFRWVDDVRASHIKTTGLALLASPASARWIALMGYLYGLASGIHLLNLLSIFFTGYVIFFEKFEKENWKRGQFIAGIVATGIISSICFFVIYPGVIQWFPVLAEKAGLILALALALGICLGGLYWSQTTKHQLANLFFMGLTLVMLGYSTYALIFIRSAANPPIDENDPETTEAFVKYLKREQYGSTPLLYGASYNNETQQVDKDKLFPRRWSDQSPDHLAKYAEYTSDWSFFWDYQIREMYVRYFMWNFVGRSSDKNGAEWTALPTQRPATDLRSWSEQESQNVYYALPLLLGLIGLFWHFNKDPRRAFTIALLFFITGIGIILYLNQTPVQARERDYSFAASFFAFSIWIGIGAAGILETLSDFTKKNVAILGVVAALLFAAVPGLMLQQNYNDHNRANNYVAPEYAHNMLNSLAPNAILFTNGDNDTFPLWYLQEVENVRKDVRVVNLSLLNTNWYINQLKNQKANATDVVPISLTEAQIQDPRPCAIADPNLMQQMGIDAPLCESYGFKRDATDNTLKSVLSVNQNLFTGDLKAALMGEIPTQMPWAVKGRPYGEGLNILQVSDIATIDIVKTNAAQGWKRPIYFAVTVSDDGYADLQPYFHLEGLAYRVLPIAHEDPNGRIVPSILKKRLDTFKFTGLNQSGIYFDQNIRQMTDNYRTLYAQYAETLSQQGRKAEALQVLNKLSQQLGDTVIPPDFYSSFRLGQAYTAAGNSTNANKYFLSAENIITDLFKYSTIGTKTYEQAKQYGQGLISAYIGTGDFVKAATLGNKLSNATGDPNYKTNPTELKAQFEAFKKMQQESLNLPQQQPTSPPDTTLP